MWGRGVKDVGRDWVAKRAYFSRNHRREERTQRVAHYCIVQFDRIGKSFRCRGGEGRGGPREVPSNAPCDHSPKGTTR